MTLSPALGQTLAQTLGLTLGLVLTVLAMPAASADRVEQRQDFLAAERALAAGDDAAFAELADGLRDYPLWPYLRLAELRRRLAPEHREAIEGFIGDHAGTAPGETLRRLWLNRLHAAGDHAGYVRNYADNGSETRECRWRRGLLALGRARGRAQAAFAGLADLYLTGASLPEVCDPVFAAWYEAGGLEPELVWQRVGLALARRNTGVAGYQRRYLPERHRRWLDQHLALYRNPEGLKEAQLPDDPDRRTAALVAGIERLAQTDPRRAAADWAVLEAREFVPLPARDRAVTAIGAGLARAGERTGLVYLRRLRPLPENLALQRERLRAALRLRAWPEVIDWVRALPPGEGDHGEWQYWLARALAKRGDLVGAAHALDVAAEERDLWGFRAAELLGRPPALRSRPTPADPEEIERLLATDTAQRIRELKALGRRTDVTREWRELTRNAGAEALRTAALLAERLELVTESIFTLARSEYWDDIRLRFPLHYEGLVAGRAADYALPPEWVYAVIRQESAFDADIASHAGAVGLMQLMPGTAGDMARELGRPRPGRLDLIDPALNIALGTRYLAAMRERFGGNQVLATAAYNAGPGAVTRWLPEDTTPADLWMLAIPYRETRDYVRRVLTYRVIYAQRLGLDDFRLGALLAPISPLSEPATAAAD
ncbi:lytic transglycosylase domain-containing protein [Thiohalocapsa halophila]|uniref:lytic transglycosylase domain-containing protein n=1 Tax=Thiohalocapsa halophila TaxID=69359 RepID=UPI001906B056|nr:lytic transglycosylase domain-containing protein [Thiohalocapsa halophila]